jgi:hypothetical protein
MYANGGGLSLNTREKRSEKSLNLDDDVEQLFNKKKRFTSCICPKCSAQHDVYMLWAGRGTPRIFCGHCKPTVSGYGEAAYYEVSGGAQRKANQSARRYGGE